MSRVENWIPVEIPIFQIQHENHDVLLLYSRTGIMFFFRGVKGCYAFLRV